MSLACFHFLLTSSLTFKTFWDLLLNCITGFVLISLSYLIFPEAKLNYFITPPTQCNNFLQYNPDLEYPIAIVG